MYYKANLKETRLFFTFTLNLIKSKYVAPEFNHNLTPAKISFGDLVAEPMSWGLEVLSLLLNCVEDGTMPQILFEYYPLHHKTWKKC